MRHGSSGYGKRKDKIALIIFDMNVIDKVTQKLSNVVWTIPISNLYVFTSYALSSVTFPHWKIMFLLKFIRTRFRKLFWYSNFNNISVPDGPFFITNNTILNLAFARGTYTRWLFGAIILVHASYLLSFLFS